MSLLLKLRVSNAAVKNVNPQTWVVTTSFDGLRHFDYPAGDLPGGAPSLGVAASQFQEQNLGSSPTTITFTTQASGSSIIVPTFIEFATASVPTDNKSNTFTQVYEQGYFGGAFAGYGLRLCVKTNAAGGSSHTISMAKPGNNIQESSLIGIEVINGVTLITPTPITVAAGGAGVAHSPASITTTGPAALIAIWGGDSGSGSHDANPDGAWIKGQGLNLPNAAYIQAWTATRVVASAGIYTCTWTPAGNEGAILAMVAVQA